MVPTKITTFALKSGLLKYFCGSTVYYTQSTLWICSKRFSKILTLYRQWSWKVWYLRQYFLGIVQDIKGSTWVSTIQDTSDITSNLIYGLPLSDLPSRARLAKCSPQPCQSIPDPQVSSPESVVAQTVENRGSISTTPFDHPAICSKLNKYAADSNGRIAGSAHIQDYPAGIS